MQITIREPGSAITHFIGMMMAVFAAVPLLTKSALSSGHRSLTALSILRQHDLTLWCQRNLSFPEPQR